MKTNALIYLIVGIIAVVGALFAAYVNILIGDAMSAIASLDAAPGTDAATIKEGAQALGGVLIAAWIWIIAVFASGVISAKTGLDALRK